MILINRADVRPAKGDDRENFCRRKGKYLQIEEEISFSGKEAFLGGIEHFQYPGGRLRPIFRFAFLFTPARRPTMALTAYRHSGTLKT